MPLTTNVSLLVRALLTGATDHAPLTAPHALSYATGWASGVAANQADLVWSDKRTLAASANEDLDLAGVLAGALGGTVTFARVKLLMVLADAANTNNVVVGAAAATAWVGPFGAGTHTVAVQPGGCALFAAPGATAWPVGAGATDFLRIANSAGGTSVTYDVLAIGASA